MYITHLQSPVSNYLYPFKGPTANYLTALFNQTTSGTASARATPGITPTKRVTNHTRRLFPLLASLSLSCWMPVAPASYLTITTVAGNGTSGFSGDGGPATNAQLNWPMGVVVDHAGNLYISEYENNVIRKVTPAGVITTIVGNTTVSNCNWGGHFGGDNGPATNASIDCPTDLALDSTESNLYVADQYNARVRRVNLTTGIIDTVAGINNGSVCSGGGYAGDSGPATGALLNCPNGVGLDSTGNLYIADSYAHVIRKVNTGGIISTVATGPLFYPGKAIVDNAGNLYIANANHRIRKLTPANSVTTIAGTAGTSGYSGDGGPATNAKLSGPYKMVLDSTGNLYIVDRLNHCIRRIEATTGIITTVAGTGTGGYSGDGGLPTSAQLNDPRGIAVDGQDNLYIGDNANHRVRKLIFNHLPTATAASLTGYLSVGQTVTGNYTYQDADNDLESGTTYQWYRADDSTCTTNQTAITGATTVTYPLTGTELGKYVCMAVTPKDGKEFGTLVLAISSNVIRNAFNLTLVTTGQGTVSSSGTPAGTPCGPNCLTYLNTTAITLTAIPGNNSTFAGWSPATCVAGMTINADTTCTATFNLVPPVTPPPLPDYLGLFLRLDGTGSGKVTTDTGLSCHSSDCQKQTDGSLLCNPPTCSQPVKTASTVTLTPQADLGSYFSSWGGHQDCLTSPMLMDSGKLCIAYFHLRDEPLTVVIQGQGSVTAPSLTCPGTCTATYPYGTTVTLQPQPATGWQFQAWSGDCEKNGQVLMTSTKNCGATFLLNVDEDLDHIPTAVEEAAPNHGDGNGDGILDTLQSYVSSFVDAVNGVYLTLQVDKTCPITNVYGELPDKYSGVNSNHKFLQGLTYFELSCAKTQVTIYYHRVRKLYGNLKFYKYGPTVPGDMKTVGWYKYPATFAVVQIGGQPVLTATYTLTDGQLGDSTGVDGKIVDPAGIELE